MSLSPDTGKALGWNGSSQIVNVAGTGGQVVPDPGKVLGWGSGPVLDNIDLDSAITLPGDGRTVTTLSAYLENNAVFNIEDYGAVGDDSTDNATAIQDAIDAAATAGGGVVLIPAGKFRYTVTPQMRYIVNIVGYGGYLSVLRPVGCDGIELGANLYGAGFGNLMLCNFGIDGSGLEDAANVGIRNVGTTDEADAFYGLTIQGMLVSWFGCAVSLRTCRNIWITNCWFSNVTEGVKIEGFVVVVKCYANQITYGEDVTEDPGYATGILLKSFNYTGGGGILVPEGVQIIANQVYGFETAINVVDCNYCNVLANDLQASRVGVEFTTAQIGFTIRDNIVDMANPLNENDTRCVWGHSVSSSYESRVVIDANQFIGGADAAITVGVEINDAEGQYQDTVRITNNSSYGFGTCDIRVNNGNDVLVRGNRCRSSAPTNSIVINGAVGPSPIIVDENYCDKALSYSDSDVVSGVVVIGENTLAGVKNLGTRDVWRTPTYAAGNFTANGSMTWTVDAGDIDTLAYTVSNKVMTVSFNISGTSVGGTPNIELRIAIPAGKMAAKSMFACAALFADNGTRATGYLFVNASGSFIAIRRLDGASWSASSNNTAVYGQLTFEIS